ncbi:MAG: peptide chain release factor family protein [Oligosphaeraceae bacterium]
MEKYSLLALSDESLREQCRVEASLGTGPGGQKRNKTSTSVRVTHQATGISAGDDTSRSQHQNLRHALRKLRWELAVSLAPSPGELAPSLPLSPIPGSSSPQYPLWLGRIFDVLRREDFQLSPAAGELGCTASQLARLLGKDSFAWQKLSQERQRRQLPPLHR